MLQYQMWPFTSAVEPHWHLKGRRAFVLGHVSVYTYRGNTMVLHEVVGQDLTRSSNTEISGRLQSHACCFWINYFGNHYWVPMAWVLSLWQVCQFVLESLPSHHWGKYETEHALITITSIQFIHQWSIMHLSAKDRFISQNIRHRSPRPKEWRICRSCCASQVPKQEPNSATEKVTFYDLFISHDWRVLWKLVWNLNALLKSY